MITLCMWARWTRGHMAAIERKTKRYPTDPTDEECERIAPLVPRPARRARKPEIEAKTKVVAPNGVTSMLKSLRWQQSHCNLVLMRNHRLVFCPIPKVACSNWKITLRHTIGYTGYDENIAHDRTANGLTYLHTIPKPQRALWLLRPDVTRAVFVRNPWTRLLSAYRSKIEGRSIGNLPNRTRNYFQRCIIEQMGGGPVSFEEFVTFLEQTPLSQMNEHWMPQYLIAGLDEIKYNFIGKMETLEEDAILLVRRCGLASFYTGNIATVPKTASSENLVLATYYSSQLIDRVGRIYIGDIQRLGYTSPW